eukprot:360672-Chlamydomonas_euryale.AAC.11
MLRGCGFVTNTSCHTRERHTLPTYTARLVYSVSRSSIKPMCAKSSSPEVSICVGIWGRCMHKGTQSRWTMRMCSHTHQCVGRRTLNPHPQNAMHARYQHSLAATHDRKSCLVSLPPSSRAWQRMHEHPVPEHGMHEHPRITPPPLRTLAGM